MTGDSDNLPSRIWGLRQISVMLLHYGHCASLKHFPKTKVMPLPQRPVASVLAVFNHGGMIANPNDPHVDNKGRPYGVGFQILDKSGFEENEVNLLLALLDRRRKYFGDGVGASTEAPMSACIRLNGRGICMPRGARWDPRRGRFCVTRWRATLR
jgi:hypothetical protein